MQFLKRTIAQRALVSTATMAVAFPAGAGVIQAIGTLPGGAGSSGLGVSADGSTAVGTSYWQGGPGHAARWTSSGGLEDLGVLPGGTGSQGYSASADGSVVVGFSVVTQQRAFRWAQGQGMQDIGSLPGGAAAAATAVSADGSVVTGWSYSPTGRNAFRWTAAGMEDLGLLPGDTWSISQGISADGNVIVGYRDTPAGSRAFRWTRAAGMVDLPFSRGASDASASCASGDGSVIGGGSGPNACLWTSSGVQDLGTLSGYLGGGVSALSGDGSIAVGYDFRAPGNTTGFVWTAAMGHVAVADYLAGLGINTSGWTFAGVSGISADGRTLVGTGDYNGVQTGYIVTVPGPGAGALFGGTAAWAINRRRRAPSR